MFETLIRWSLRFRSLTLACAGLLLVAGIHAWLNLGAAAAIAWEIRL